MYITHFYKKIQMDSKTNVNRRVSSCNKILATADFFFQEKQSKQTSFLPTQTDWVLRDTETLFSILYLLDR